MSTVSSDRVNYQVFFLKVTSSAVILTTPFPCELRRNECQFRLNKIENRQRANQLCQKENQFCMNEIHFRRSCHDPLPVVILPVARVYQDSAEGTDKDKVNTFKLMELI